MNRIILIISTVFVLIALNVTVYQYEQLKNSSDSMLLALAPLDPRSLIQGDYMQLRYAIERDTSSSVLPETKRGFLVVKLDANRVGQFVRFHQNEVLEVDERLVRYHRQYSQLRIVPDTFFFQEGHAAHYEDAKYGYFITDGARKHLLTGLAGENFERIAPLLK